MKGKERGWTFNRCGRCTRQRQEKKGYTVQYYTHVYVLNIELRAHPLPTSQLPFPPSISGRSVFIVNFRSPASSIFPLASCSHSIPAVEDYSGSRTRDKRHPCFLNELAVFRFAEGKRTSQTDSHNVTHPLFFAHPKVKLTACWSCFYLVRLGH